MDKKRDQKLVFLEKAICAAIGGCIGAFVGTPADVSLVRMSTDGLLPASKSRNYTSVFNALFRIRKDDIEHFGAELYQR